MLYQSLFQFFRDFELSIRSDKISLIRYLRHTCSNDFYTTHQSLLCQVLFLVLSLFLVLFFYMIISAKPIFTASSAEKYLFLPSSISSFTCFLVKLLTSVYASSIICCNLFCSCSASSCSNIFPKLTPNIGCIISVACFPIFLCPFA